MDGINLNEVATGGTHFHDQKGTNFCHSFAVVSGLRNSLRKAAGNKEKVKVEQLLTDNYIADIFKNVCTFQAMFAGFINNVNPRSLDGLDGDRFRKSKMANQAAYVDKVLKRLTSKTMFETHGWKRILGVHTFFETFELNPENYKLEAIKVTHPIAVGNITFQHEIMAEKEGRKRRPKSRNFDDQSKVWITSKNFHGKFQLKHLCSNFVAKTFCRKNVLYT